MSVRGDIRRIIRFLTPLLAVVLTFVLTGMPLTIPTWSLGLVLYVVYLFIYDKVHRWIFGYVSKND